MNHMGQRPAYSAPPAHQDTANVDAAVADKHPDPSLFSGNVPFRRQFAGLGLGPAYLAQERAAAGRRTGCFHDRLRDVLGTLHGAAHVNTGAGRCHRQKTVGHGEVVLVEIDLQPFGQLHRFLADFKADREHHHVEHFIAFDAVFVHIGEAQVAFAFGLDGVHPRTDRTRPHALWRGCSTARIPCRRSACP